MSTHNDNKNKVDLISVLLALTLTLVIVGALNWGASAYGYNLVEMIGGKDTMISKTVYTLVAVSGLYLVGALLTKKLKLKC